jgi:uncharacterized protein
MALKAITVKLTRSAYVKVSRVAKSRGLTQSAVIREAIDALREPAAQSFLEAAGDAVEGLVDQSGPLRRLRPLKDLIADTGPLVALLNRGDQHHKWARRTFAGARVPVFTVEAVVSECLFLLRRNRLDPKGLFDLLESGALRIQASSEAQTTGSVRLCRTYGDVPMSWADAGLVLLSEQHPKAFLATFDSDFTVYRRFGSERLPVLRHK